MTDDFERELRDRLRSASLPPAPSGPWRRLESVVNAPRRQRRLWPFGDRPVLGPAVVAILVVALAAAALTTGGFLGPDTTPAPSAVAVASGSPTPPAAPTEPPARTPPIVCTDGGGAISCELATALALARLGPTHGAIRYVKVTRPPRACLAPSVGGTCTPDVMVEIVFADPRDGIALVAVNSGDDGVVASEVFGPRAPEVICDQGSYPADALTCDRAIDAAMSLIGTDHPWIGRITFVHSCSDVLGGPSDCAVQYSGVVSITYDSSPETTAAVFVQSTSLSVEASFTSTASPEIHCSEAPDPARTCAEIIEAVLILLGPNHPPIARIDASNICRNGLIPSCRRANWVDVTFAGSERVQVRLFIRETPSGAFVEDPAPLDTRRFEPPYSTVAPLGDGPWIWRAQLSDDRRTLSVDFFAPVETGPCFGDYEAWVGHDGDNLVVKIVRVDAPIALPSPTPSVAGLPGGIDVIACLLVGTRHHYDLVLPEPFIGTAVRDLNGGILVLTP